MLETSARLLRLLSLFQTRRYWAGPDLASRLDVTPRTLRRDVDKLRSLGYPIHSSTGAEGGYRLGAGSTMPPLLLDDEEAVAVALGLRSAANGAITGIEEASMRALLKIEQILPARLARRLSALQSMIVTSGVARAPVDAKVLSTIAGACRDQVALQFRYQDHAGTATARSVEPHRLVHQGYRWYLVAWDTGRADWRTFRVDRIQPRVTTGATFVARDAPARDLAAYVSRGAAFAPPCRARVKFFAPAEAVVQRVPPQYGSVEPIDDATCYLNTGSASYESLAIHMAWLGLDFEVEEPPELAEQVRRLAERYARATL